MKPALFCAAALLLCAAKVRAEGKALVAVLEFKNHLKAADKDAIDTSYLSDRVRGALLDAAPGLLRVMTRENMVVLLGASGKNVADCEGECEVDTGRRLGADYVVSGDVLRFGSNLKVNLKVHETAEGSLIASKEASGKDADALDQRIGPAVEKLLAPLRERLGAAKAAPPEPEAKLARKQAPPAAAPAAPPDQPPARPAAAEAAPRKEATSGNGRFTIHADGSVTDATTGLTWAGQDNGAGISFDNAAEYIEAKGGGFRMPKESELRELASAGITSCSGGALIKLSDCYIWAVATEQEYGGHEAFALSLADGAIERRGRFETRMYTRALPVRDAQGTATTAPKRTAAPAGRFVSNGDGTVTDTKTGLVWTASDNGNNGISFNDAVKAIAGLGSGFRLPREDELRELCAAKVTSFQLGKTQLIKLTESHVWSAPPTADVRPGRGYALSFESCAEGDWNDPGDARYYTRMLAVHSGAPP